MPPSLSSQTPAAVSAPECRSIHKGIAPKDPRRGPDGIILPGQTIVRMKLAIGPNTTITIIEHPRAGVELDDYNCTIIVKRGQESKKYSMKVLTKGGEGDRIVEVANLCTSPEAGMLFLAFEEGYAGYGEGFAVVRYSPDAFDVRALPSAYQGRIVVNKADPNKVEVWSAEDSASKIECGACPKYYGIQDCEIGLTAVTCQRRAGPRKIRLPDKFIGARIDTH